MFDVANVFGQGKSFQQFVAARETETFPRRFSQLQRLFVTGTLCGFVTDLLSSLRCCAARGIAGVCTLHDPHFN